MSDKSTTPDKTASDKPVSEKPASDKPHFVFIIDDEPATVSILKTYMDIVGFEADGALTGSTGLKKIAERKPDVLILDLMLPDTDGYTICEQLRKDPKTEALPIIILSARTGREDVKRGYKAGCSRYLKKPVNLDELSDEVKRLADKARHEAPPLEIQEKDATRRATG